MMVHMTDSMVMPCYNFWDIKHDNEWHKAGPGGGDARDSAVMTAQRLQALAAAGDGDAPFKIGLAPADILILPIEAGGEAARRAAAMALHPSGSGLPPARTADTRVGSRPHPAGRPRTGTEPALSLNG